MGRLSELFAMQMPWLQAGTSRLLTSEVSATVADEIAEARQQGARDPEDFLSPRPSRIGRLLQRYPLLPHYPPHGGNLPQLAFLCCALGCSINVAQAGLQGSMALLPSIAHDPLCCVPGLPRRQRLPPWRQLTWTAVRSYPGVAWMRTWRGTMHQRMARCPHIIPQLPVCLPKMSIR